MRSRAVIMPGKVHQVPPRRKLLKPEPHLKRGRRHNRNGAHYGEPDIKRAASAPHICIDFSQKFRFRAVIIVHWKPSWISNSSTPSI